ncbi:hypothetical protein A2631_03875 [Candidatus Daviesbacteria bacterium RIFCSPHIGHO2_01_FULL_44_29]|uniref:D-lactate dehydrogenase (cytochrome) n=1 Tax=Candidatus Daviesbacteria bacterium RIFCSPHIGHO2_02_FULL_43_12 TaxID=1797776 RepID=A0A1F5KGY6_9BACT|nr:MAG: hypothetical protein A2631_03875 [Candidatus Daviesbacteria bacterium RIFCSPHIGHO2_01_FULL_44_29]OGE39871.1 MAG: hypothetical protein A3D25_03605 [Candidatus Daviesbacteria bacterium RIFCSPHIGHO2_02_FULL_43_12]OGE70448.1 MAG: hypothetical protein A3B55_01965 [Candidatus Daviesbacteria bacterium RIFCSPLOWO2_01_FULL_43_15]
MSLKADLQEFFKGELLDDDQTLTAFSKDASLFYIRPTLVAYPHGVEDIKALIKYISAHPEKKLSITPRSAGTDMGGGAINDSIILEMTQYFNKIKEIGADFATIEPGVFYRDFEKESLKHDLLLPCYTASRELNTIGGMVANNSAGEKTLFYGQTKDYVRSLKAILSDGNEYTFEALNKSELDQKMSQKNAEGKLYREVFGLVDTHFDAIQAARPKTHKNATGYLLWEIWDKETFDLSKAFVGSQGTLGVVTEATLKLVKPQTHSRMLVIFMKNLDNLSNIVNAILRYKPESFESYDDYTMKFAMKFLPEIIKVFGPKNLFSLGFQFLPEMWMTMTGGLPKLVLLAEFTGESDAEALGKAAAARQAVAGFKLNDRITQNPEDARKYWVVRRESFNLLRKHSPHRRTAPFIDDIIVRPDVLPEFLPKLRALMSEYELIYTMAGHIGDGNFHIIPLMDLTDPKSRGIIQELGKKVYDLVFEYGGSMSAEHNDGLVRGPYLETMYGKEVYGLFKQLKNIFDPTNIFNPHKKTDATFEYSLDHIAKDSS